VHRKKVLAVTVIIFSFAGILFTLVLLKQHTDNFTHASPPDQLETEGGARTGNANIQTDSNASGGNYVALGLNSNQTPTPTISSTSLPTIQGYGAHALDGLPSNVYTVTSTAGYPSTAPGTWGGAEAWLNAGNKGTIKFAVSGTIDLGSSPHIITGRSNFLIDGRGQNITFKGGSLWFDKGDHFAVVNIRHRGGLAQSQDNDDFTNVNSHDFAYVNVSTSGQGDEGLSSTQGSYNYTLQDNLLGPGTPGHNYGSLNYGLPGPNGTNNPNANNGPASFIRNTWIGLDYRNPKVAYSDDVAPYEVDPRAISYDIVNNVVVNSTWAVSVHYGAKANITNQYLQNVPNTTDYGANGVVSTSGGFPVASYAQVTAMTATAAKDYAKTHSGALPHDSFDTNLLSQIN
jgi:hypothetical protein